ncbi:uncharacterized protein LOC111320203, partial [Stylophora pistillata]
MAARSGACCAGQDIYDAKQVAEKMNFPHYVLDYESRFRESVIDDFADSYVQGHTPVPCIRCNQTVKFQDLLKTARELGGVAMATGHYVRRIPGAKKAELHRAVDATKDQSYFLFATTQEQLDFLRFPLGGWDKSETRRQAERFGLNVAEKPDSQDICFVPDGDYTRIVSKLRPGALESGPIEHVDGCILGEHEGIIGQRRGLRVSTEEPLYVVGLDPKGHKVIVGPKEMLACQTLFIKDLNWLGDLELKPGARQDMSIQIRSTRAPVSGYVCFEEDGQIRVHFKESEYGVAPGQAVSMNSWAGVVEELTLFLPSQKSHVLKVERVTSEKELVLGLMNRSEWGKISGMLFDFGRKVRLGFSDPGHHLTATALCAGAVAFFAATQDIVYEAYRVELLKGPLAG